MADSWHIPRTWIEGVQAASISCAANVLRRIPQAWYEGTCNQHFLCRCDAADLRAVADLLHPWRGSWVEGLLRPIQGDGPAQRSIGDAAPVLGPNCKQQPCICSAVRQRCCRRNSSDDDKSRKGAQRVPSAFSPSAAATRLNSTSASVVDAAYLDMASYRCRFGLREAVVAFAL